MAPRAAMAAYMAVSSPCSKAFGCPALIVACAWEAVGLAGDFEACSVVGTMNSEAMMVARTSVTLMNVHCGEVENR